MNSDPPKKRREIETPLPAMARIARELKLRQTLNLPPSTKVITELYPSMYNASALLKETGVLSRRSMGALVQLRQMVERYERLGLTAEGSKATALVDYLDETVKRLQTISGIAANMRVREQDIVVRGTARLEEMAEQERPRMERFRVATEVQNAEIGAERYGEAFTLAGDTVTVIREGMATLRPRIEAMT